MTVAGVDVPAAVQIQRAATVRRLQQLTRLKRLAADGPELAWSLVLENLIFTAEAEVRWLDHVEATLQRRPAGLPRPGGSATPAPRPQEAVR